MSNLEWLRDTCLSLPHATEDFPFDADVLVFRIGGKIFAMISVGNADSVNLKALPELSEEWREQYTQVTPGYHMNKTHWNTVYFEGLSHDFIQEMVVHSYTLVKQKLPLKLRQLYTGTQ